MPKKKTIKDVIEKFIEVHGDKYDYSKLEYKDTHTKVKIICPIHGERDSAKNKKCKKNGINILYFSNKQYENNIIIDENKLLEKIIKNE